MTDEQSRKAQAQLTKLQTIRDLDELDGYQAEARRRGYLPGEVEALLTRRKQIARRR